MDTNESSDIIVREVKEEEDISFEVKTSNILQYTQTISYQNLLSVSTK